MLVDDTHKQAVTVLFRKDVGQIETGSTVSGKMSMIPDCFYIVINIGINMRSALLMVNAALHNMKQMGNNTAGSNSLPMIVKVETPGVGKSTRKAFK